MSFSSSTVSIGDSTKQADYARLMANTVYNKAQTISEISRLQSGTVSFEGAKTFQSATVFNSTVNITAGGSATITTIDVTATATFSGPITAATATFSGGIKTDSVVLKTTVIEIGDWDMTATTQKGVAHGIADWTKIRDISVLVRNDAATSAFNFQSFEITLSGSFLRHLLWATSTYIYMQIILDSAVEYFDDATFNSTSYNRGWITITYEA